MIFDAKTEARRIVHRIRAFRCGQIAGPDNDQHWSMCDEDTAAIAADLQRAYDAGAARSTQGEAALRPEVLAFARLMEENLRENDHKDGWRQDSPEALLRRLREETDELDVLCKLASFKSPPSTALDAKERASAGREAADVANFAMMIADVCGALAAIPATSGPAPTCLCVRPEKACEGLCSTVERWAAACRKAHWHEDETLATWPGFLAREATSDGDSEPDLWRRVARAAIGSLGGESVLIKSFVPAGTRSPVGAPGLPPCRAHEVSELGTNECLDPRACSVRREPDGERVCLAGHCDDFGPMIPMRPPIGARTNTEPANCNRCSHGAHVVAACSQCSCQFGRWPRDRTPEPIGGRTELAPEGTCYAPLYANSSHRCALSRNHEGEHQAGASTEPEAGPRVPPEKGDVWRVADHLCKVTLLYEFDGTTDEDGVFNCDCLPDDVVTKRVRCAKGWHAKHFTDGTLTFVRRGTTGAAPKETT